MTKSTPVVMTEAQADRETTDPHRANELGLDLNLHSIDCSAESNRLELERKDLQTRIRDRIMTEKQMAKTPAEAEARLDPEYVEHCELIQRYTEQADRARAFSRYFSVRAAILARSLEVSHV